MAGTLGPMRALLALSAALAAVQAGVAALVRADYLAMGMAGGAMLLSLSTAVYVWWHLVHVVSIGQRIDDVQEQARAIDRRIADG